MWTRHVQVSDTQLVCCSAYRLFGEPVYQRYRKHRMAAADDHSPATAGDGFGGGRTSSPETDER